MTITIERSALAAALLHAPKSDVRYYLNGVMIESKANEQRIVATNGYTLFCGKIGNESMPDFQIIVPRDVVAREAKGKGVVQFDGETGTLGATLFKAVDGVFPDHRRVIIDHKLEPKVSKYNPDSYAAAIKALRLFNDERNDSMPYIKQQGDHIGLFWFNARALVLVMPVREWQDADKPEASCPANYFN